MSARTPSPANHARIRAALRAAKKAGAAGFLVSDLYNVRWLSGFSGTEATLFIGPGGPLLFTDSRYTIQAAAEAPGFRIVKTVNKLHDIAARLKPLVRSLAVEAEGMTHGRFLALKKEAGRMKLIPIGEEIKKLRAIKDETEIALIERAADIALSAFRAAAREVRPGMREQEFALRLETAMRAKGSEGAPFPTIVASGPRGALPHGTASDRRMKKGDLVTVDFGALYRGYQSDQTITFCLGRADARRREIYEVVREAHDRAIAAVKAGRTAKEIDAVARECIRSRGFGEYFGHGLGHGVGLETHEAPSLNPRSVDVLKAGMVVTVEPGIYVPGLGGVRIEDMVVVEAGGGRLLTASGGKLREL